MSAHGMPRQSLMASVPNVYLNVFFSASRKFGSWTTPVPFVFTVTFAGTSTQSFFAFSTSLPSLNVPRESGELAERARTFHLPPDFSILQSMSETIVDATKEIGR